MTSSVKQEVTVLLSFQFQYHTIINSPQKEQLLTLNLDQTSSINLSLNQVVDLQLCQTELNSQLINQQRSFHLLVKEAPILSGNPFKYQAFITTFDAIITTNNKDQLFFLEKFTSCKANDYIKGFLAAGSHTAYREARKLLD